MAEDKYITAQEAEQAKKDPLKTTTRPTGARIFAAEYFAEEVRRYIADNYTERKLYEGGLSVRTTLDPKLQLTARKALIDGLVRFDETLGYHGAVTKLDLAGEWGAKLAEGQGLVRCRAMAAGGGAGDRRSGGPHRSAAGPRSRRRGPQGERETGTIPLEAVKMGEVCRRQDRDQGRPGAGARRCRVCRASSRQGRPVSVCARCPKSPAPSWPWTPIPGGFWRWWVVSPTTRASSIAPRRRWRQPGSSFQADHLFGRARQWLHALEHRA